MHRNGIGLVAIACCAAAPAWAQSCGSSNGTVTCTIGPGTYAQTISIPVTEDLPYVVTNQGTIEVQNEQFALQLGGARAAPGQSSPSLTLNSGGPIALTVSGNPDPNATLYEALQVLSMGGNGSATTAGAAAGPVSVTVNAPVSLTFTASSPAMDAYGVLAQTIGGLGGASGGKNQNGTAGGQAGDVTATISNATLSLQTQGGTPAAVLYASQVGGNGGDAASDTSANDDAAGGAAGSTGTLAVTINGSTLRAEGAGVTALIATQVGGAGGWGGNASQGGQGGATGSLDLTLNAATVSASAGDAVDATQVGGAGGNASTGSSSARAKGGQGGSTGLLTASVTDAAISAGGRGLVLQQTGGAGGNGNSDNADDYSDGYTGGATGGISLIFSQATTGTTISTTGSHAAGVLAQATGGAGGTGASTGGGVQIGVGSGNGGDGGNASGDSGEVLVQSSGTLTITTGGNNSPGVAAIGQGGLGGNAGYVSCNNTCYPGAGGSGGRGDPVAVDLGAGAAITTAGQTAPAVAAQSFGGSGGAAGGGEAAFGDLSGTASGYGGIGGLVTVTLAGGVTLTTTGTQSPALLVQSIGGQGGSSYGVADIDAPFGNAIGASGGAGGNANGASVTSSAAIATSGDGSRGIMVQAMSGPGGAGGGVNGATGTGGQGGVSGTIAATTVSNSGAITTLGAGAQGILVQSVAGGGGAGGSSFGYLFSEGGSAVFANANGGTVTITNSGSVSTAGAVAAAILGQSVGGGGGDGGPSSGVLYNHGGDGTAGGDGAAVTANLGGSLSTGGTLSHGLLAQSIGGSGGSGGNAVSDGTVATYVVGGSAGPGGAGGDVTVGASFSRLSLQGSGANGIVAQSVGGGGGAGGAAYALDAGISFAFAGAVGGSGGSGGDGGNVTVTTANTTISTGRPASPGAVLPVDAIGIIAQSISGGGGVGGGASAEAVAVGMVSPSDSKSLAITATYAVGGSGGSGGSANGSVTATLQDGTSVATAGAGSIGVLAQSIGGGGGQGGDSSTFSATIGSANKYLTASGGTQTVSLNYAAGAGGGSGGNAWQVTASLGNASGPAPGGSAGISTTGDYADGMLLQSIGGGGGNAGAGSSQMNTTGAGSSVKISLDMGAKGGAGGYGGPITLNLYPESTVTTEGSGAAGVVAQSIGGGGGNSTGYTLNLDSPSVSSSIPHVSVAANLTLGMGAKGGSANNGDTITAFSAGRIVTVGDDAPGLLLQSIGGGGGVGGSPGVDAAASGDRTESPAPNAAAAGAMAASDDSGPSVGAMTFTANTALTLGGAGGAAGNGGPIALTEQGSVQTSGDYSPGIVMQSIGGGGGRGGSALVGTQSNSLSSIVSELTVYTNISLGANGGGGTGGIGSNPTLTLNGATIRTGVPGQGSAGTGFQSFGALVQSIGGGGGMAADGTAGPNGVAVLGAGSGGGGGDGGTVLIQQTGGPANTIGTTGDSAIGIVAQSIGGGGGVYGAGSSAPVTNTLYVPNVTLHLGSQSSTATGSGGSVTFDYPGLNITTAGANSFGVLAQSIGAGGGLAAVGGTATVSQLGAANAASGNGGDVTVDLASSGSITTSGVGAHGVVAQSIGGGGGVAVLTSPGTVPSLTNVHPWTSNSFGTGGAVAVETHAPITVTGAGAFAILAQSVSGGGGLATTSPGVVYAGSTNGGGASESAGNVSVTTQGRIEASGPNGTAIFAQSAATDIAEAYGSVTVNLEGGLSGSSVTGGSGAQGYGVWVAGGNAQNQLNVDSGVTLSAASGTPINYTGWFGVNVQNNGSIEGSNFNLGSGTLTNNAVLALAGPATPGGRFYGPATLNGNLAQTASGQIRTDVDFAAHQAGYLVVTGNAALGGSIVPRAATVLPNIDVPVMIVGGTVTGSIGGSHSALFAYDAHDPPQVITLSARATGFAPAGFDIRGAAAEMAAYLLPVFNTASTVQLGTLFANLDALADAGAPGYVDALRQLSPGSALAFASRARAETTAFGDALLRCDSFVGGSAITTETGCGWMEISGGVANQGSGGGYAGFSDSTVNYRIGGQALLAPGWVLGGALGYSHSWLDGEFYATGSGDAGYAGLSLTREWRGFRFTGALLGSYSGNSTTRTVSIPGFESVLDGKPDVDSQAALLHADYTFGTGRAYLRPSMTVAVVRVHAGAFTESGQGTVGLGFGDGSQVSGVFAPRVEVGLRTDLPDGMALRSFLALGASLPTSTRFHQPIRLQGAALAAGDVQATEPTDGAAATVGAGLQLFARGGLDVRLAYEGAFSGRVTDNAGLLVGTLHF